MATRASRLRSAASTSASPTYSSRSHSNAHSPEAKAAARPPVLMLPMGSCNYRDLGTPYTCGCVRFMLHVDQPAVPPEHASGVPAGPAPERAWCYCGHHACFHNLSTPTQPNTNDTHDELVMPPPLPSSLPGGRCTPSFLQAQISSSPPPLTSPKRMAHAPRLSAGSDVPIRPTSRVHAHQPHSQHSDALHSSSSGLRDIQASGLAVWLNDDDAIAAHAPATRMVRKSFGQYVQSTVQKPPASIPSTTDSPFDQHIHGDRALLNHVISRQQAVVVRTSPTPASARDSDAELDDYGSATEVATPSLMGTPALNGADATVASLKAGLDDFTKKFPSQQPASIQNASIEDLLKQLTALKAILMNTPNLASSLGTLNNRIDALECTSFSHGPSEELLERLELFEGRLIEVEEKVDEISQRASVEQRYAVKHKIHHDLNSSFASSHAQDESPAARTVDRIETAETRLRTLQGSLVLDSRAWSVQVVVLPWGRGLRGIWYAADADTRAEDIGPNTALDATQSHPMHVGTFNWKQDDRMTPRACADNSIVYQRLKSRGFVKTFTFYDTSADSIASQIATMSTEKLVPLRKVHKASRLRFLDHDELQNRDIWSAESLGHDIVMKGPGGQLTLFVTEMAGYSQNRGGHNHTWQNLRELPRVDLNDTPGFAQTFSPVGEADALESCWTWIARLDPPPSVHSSFSGKADHSLHSSFASHPLSPEPTEPEDRNHSPDHLAASMSECSVQSANLRAITAPTHLRLLPISPHSDEQLSLPPHRRVQRAPSPFRRTISLPLSASDPSIFAQQVTSPKRNVASFDHASSSRLVNQPLLDSALHQKRRRLSRTPEAAVTLWGLTPRRSREPPSPNLSMTDDAPTQVRERGVSQAYATPFSHNATIPSRQRGTLSHSMSACGSGSGNADMGADTDVDEDNTGQADSPDDDSEADDDDDDEEETWEGLVDDHDDMDVDAVNRVRRYARTLDIKKEGSNDDEGEDYDDEEEEEQ